MNASFIKIIIKLIIQSALSAVLTVSFAQSLTIEDIFLNNKYKEKRPDNLRFMKDDRFYTEQVGSMVLKKATLSGKTVDTLVAKTDTLLKGKFDLFDYEFSPDEKLLLLAGNRQGIYRRSFTADYVLVTNHERVTINNISYATFSPDGKKIAYVKDNNLFFLDLVSQTTKQVTIDGKKNYIINGSTDWVYEEEFEFTKAFFWSPDSRYLVFYRFDETEVPEYNMQKWDGLYPTDYRFKYPKAGEKNAKVAIKVFDLQNGQTEIVRESNDSTYYFPVIAWDKIGKEGLQIITLDRSQTLLTYGRFQKRFTTSIELEDYSFFLPNLLIGENGSFEILSQKNAIAEILKDAQKDNDVRFKQLAGLCLYYIQSKNAIETECYRINYVMGKIEKLSFQTGHNSMYVSEAGNFYILTNSSSGHPPTVALYDTKTKKPIRILEDNSVLRQRLQPLNLPEQKFFQFTTSENVKLNGWMIKPKDFDSTKKYPVIMFEYGGPGSQMVHNAWTGTTFLWHQFLASQGFVVVCVDGRGTGGRGTAFRTCTYKRLGELETKDQIEAAKHLGKLHYVDKDRIGIWGWSFGGYLSSLSILLGNDVFKAAIAVAPVTTWRFYDTIYTERYLNTPQDNAVGYDKNSPITYADRLKGNYLLIHGTADDNVHFQHTIAMQDALIKAGKQFDTFIYPNKAHGISGGKTRVHLYTLMLNFWKEKLQ